MNRPTLTEHTFASTPKPSASGSAVSLDLSSKDAQDLDALVLQLEGAEHALNHARATHKRRSDEESLDAVLAAESHHLCCAEQLARVTARVLRSAPRHAA